MSAGELSSGDYNEDRDDNNAEENDFNDATTNYSDEAPRNQKDPKNAPLYRNIESRVKRSKSALKKVLPLQQQQQQRVCRQHSKATHSRW